MEDYTDIYFFIGAGIFFAIVLLKHFWDNREDNDYEEEDYDEDNESDGDVEVPFTRDSYGSMYVWVYLNGQRMKMMVDTGCSDVMITKDKFEQLKKKGLVSKWDYRGGEMAVMANGATEWQNCYRIKEIQVGSGKNSVICYDVKVSVTSARRTDSLLGTGVFNQFSSYVIDNERKVICFEL
ncbi:MAG: retroviral-like aspartic protease family protein [Bacteroidales bacterium]|nr:retroviral-like aspartic protease family protein [Bacteroidales bacterium]